MPTDIDVSNSDEFNRLDLKYSYFTIHNLATLSIEFPEHQDENQKILQSRYSQARDDFCKLLNAGLPIEAEEAYKIVVFGLNLERFISYRQKDRNYKKYMLGQCMLPRSKNVELTKWQG